jgi:hypothetical protein
MALKETKMDLSKDEIIQITKETVSNLEDEKWNWVKFLKGWINHKFIAFIITTLMINKIIFGKGLSLAANETIVVIIVWGVVTVFFILGKAIDNAIYNAKITAEFKAGAQANINTDTAKVIEAVKNLKGE